MHITRIDLSNSADTQALLTVLNDYASKPSGGNTPLPTATMQTLPQVLAACPTYLGLLAWTESEDQQAKQAIGLLNAFWSVSTFKAQRLINIHDIAVIERSQRQGVGRRLLREIELLATEMQCCKITLEVLEGNAPAMALYKLMGFETYQLDPAMGNAQFMQKWLTK